MKLVTAILCILTLLDLAAASAVETEYYALFADGKKAGSAVRTRSIEADIVTTTEKMVMNIARVDMAMTITTLEKNIETTDGTPIGFESLTNTGGIEQKVTGKINAQGKLDITISGITAPHRQIRAWPAGAVMSEGMRLLTIKKGLAEGTSYSALLFSPALLSAVNTKVRIGPAKNVDLLGRLTRLTEVSISMQTSSGTVNTTSYVDSRFKDKKMIIPMLGMNLELIACDKAFALSDNDVMDFLDKLLLQSPISLDTINAGDSVTYYLKPTAGVKLNIPSTDNQKVTVTKDGLFTVTVAPAQPTAGIRFPYKGNDPQVLDALKPTQYIQSDRQEIIELARRAVGNTEDAATAAKRIEKFVFDYITAKDLSIGYGSAAEVAAGRQGDCSEHAVLTAAMCKAVGIPARIACGLVYVKEFAGRNDIFAGHAWTEAYIDDKWVGLDATKTDSFGPGHITIATGSGDPADFFGMVSTLGYFKIEKAVIATTD